MNLHKNASKLLITFAVALVAFVVLSAINSGPHVRSAASGPDWPAVLQAVAALIGVIAGPLGLVGVLRKPAPTKPEPASKEFYEVGRNYDGEDAVTVWIRARDQHDRPVWDEVICRPGRGR